MAELAQSFNAVAPVAPVAPVAALTSGVGAGLLVVLAKLEDDGGMRPKMKSIFNQLVESAPDKLAAVHPDLQAVIERAAEISEVPFIVTEGCRSQESQQAAVRRGASWTMNSRHQYGHAVDLMPAVVKNGVPALVDQQSWKHYKEEFQEIQKSVREAANEKGVSLAFFKSDAPHVELDKKAYPVPKYEDREFCQ